MAVLRKTRNDFLSTLASSRALFNHCLVPRGPHTEAGIEAAFLQMYKGWEGFLEECFIALMCGRLTCDGKLISCHVRAPGDVQARRILYQNRSYLEWTDADEVRNRIERYFDMPNRLETTIRACLSELRHMTRIRNAIAHSSQKSVDHFRKMVQGQFGGKPVIDRPAHFLEQSDRNDPTKTYFDRYADILETAASSITG